MQAFGWKRRIPLRNSTPILAAFHSTPLSLSKWKTKWKNQDEEGSQKPSKTYARYAVRLKRADTKKALKDFLLYGKPSNMIQDEDSTQSRRSKAESRLHEFNNCLRSNGSGRSKPSSNSSECGKGKRRKGKRWNDKWSYGYYDDDFGHHEANFQASFGGHKTFNWSFPSWEKYRFENSTSGFEWRDEAKWEKIKKKFLNESDIEEEEPSDVGTHTDRVALGLPATGSLKVDDVKIAFRTSALKWHPDKHQGPSQAVAAEKFKRCVDAYNSLCNALKKN
ncbi:DnaJ domain-containing protein [Dioscorea alata]|uniref:DnaJ domain-containing protein n=1 Tax=Dioscorea alata TaxID=55571 RepID=A0ACB7WCE4_DIOAL|nr:DnaJ domain-containing protein [Dioscorea alata]